MNTNPQTIVALLGARREYAVPVLLHRAGMLAHFYTDAYVGKGWLRLVRLVPPSVSPAGLRRLSGRRCELPTSKVTAFNRLGFEYWWRLQRAKCRSEMNAAHLWAGEAFGKLVCKSGFNGASVVYGFKLASSVIFEYSRSKGVKCFLDHFSAPTRIYDRILAEEEELLPGWEASWHDTGDDGSIEWESQEWKLADVILVPSQFVKGCLIQSGVQAEKCLVVPYGIDVGKRTSSKQTSYTADRLRVLFVGRVQLMKGIQYLLQAARKLGDLIEVRVVGATLCNKERLLAATPSNTEYMGQVPQAEVYQHFEWADVFCLPSLCEGSAGVTYEALAAGIPVICTPNTGSVVQDGIDGYIVPIRDSDAIAETLEILARDRKLLTETSRNASQRAEEYNWERYGERLAEAIKSVKTASCL